MKETISKRLNNLFMITHSSVVGPRFKKGSVPGRSLCSEPLCCDYFRDPYFCSWHVSSQFLQILILPSILPPIPSPYSVGSQIVSVLLLLSQSHTYSLIQVFATSHQDSISFMVSICCYKESLKNGKEKKNLHRMQSPNCHYCTFFPCIFFPRHRPFIEL